MYHDSENILKIFSIVPFCSMHQSFRLVFFFSILLIEAYIEVHSHLKGPTLPFTDISRCYCVVHLYELYGVRMSAVLKLLHSNNPWYKCSHIICSRLQIVKVTRAAFLPFSHVVFINIIECR